MQNAISKLLLSCASFETREAKKKKTDDKHAVQCTDPIFRKTDASRKRARWGKGGWLQLRATSKRHKKYFCRATLKVAAKARENPMFNISREFEVGQCRSGPRVPLTFPPLRESYARLLDSRLAFFRLPLSRALFLDPARETDMCHIKASTSRESFNKHTIAFGIPALLQFKDENVICRIGGLFNFSSRNEIFTSIIYTISVKKLNKSIMKL